MPALVIFAVVIGIVAAIIALAAIQSRKRREAFQSIAQVLGFVYSGAKNLLQSSLTKSFQLFSLGHGRRTYNVMEGQSGDAEITIFDYKFTVGHGKNRNTYTRTVVAVTSDKMQIPQFELKSENLFHKIGSTFGYQDIDFENFPTFSKKYLLRGDNEQAVRGLFHNEVITYFENHPKLYLEGSGDTFIYVKNSTNPDELPNIMQEVMQVYGFFRR